MGLAGLQVDVMRLVSRGVSVWEVVSPGSRKVEVSREGSRLVLDALLVRLLR